MTADAVDTMRRTARAEILATLPYHRSAAADLRRTRDDDLGALQRGVRGCLLTEAAAFTDSVIRAELEVRMDSGALVRLVGGGLRGMVLYDRRTAVVPRTPTSDGSPKVINHPELVRDLHSEFTCFWRGARTVSEHLAHDSGCCARHRDLLAQMKDGVTDDTAARRMGVSIRTYRRYVAGLMQDLGAASRFQAGVRAAARGWVG